MLFLHRLQQRRLGAGAGAVDFVGHQQLGEDRALDEAEGALAADAFFHHFGAGDVGGHQVGGELDAAGVQPHHDAQRFHQLGLGQARHADQQAMAAGQQGHQGLLDHLVLAEDHGIQAGAHLGEGLGGGSTAALAASRSSWMSTLFMAWGLQLAGIGRYVAPSGMRAAQPPKTSLIST